MGKKITTQEFDNDLKLEIEGSLNFAGSVVDTNGIYTVGEYTRPDGTLHMKSTLSNPDVNGNYQTQTVDFYQADGITLRLTKTVTMVYDANGGLQSRTVS